MKYAAPFDPTGSLKVPDTSLHLRGPRRVAAPYYKPSRQDRHGRDYRHGLSTKSMRPSTLNYSPPLPRETARRAVGGDSVKSGPLERDPRLAPPPPLDPSLLYYSPRFEARV